MLADGTRIVEVNNKIVSIGGTYNDPEIYSVLLINAEMKHMQNMLRRKFLVMSMNKEITVEESMKKSGKLLHLCMEKKISDTIMRMIISIKRGR